MMTLNRLVEILRNVGIEAALDEDLEGQVIVYTGMMVDPNDENHERLIPFEEAG